jgi:hypothetical protein
MTTLVRHDLTDPAIPEGMVRIVLGGSYRFIWPVHLGGWQSLGWQLQPAAGLTAPEPRLPEPEPELEPELEPNLIPDPDPEEETDQDLELGSESDVTEPMSLAAGTELQTALVGTDFQAMTKAQILEHCSSVYGVEFDGSQTKAELVEQATALEIQSAPSNEEPLADGLLDLDDPLI